jgi:aclacinomycin oxidase
VSTIPGRRYTPGEPRYRSIVEKRFNKRFKGQPEYVRLVDSTAEVVDAVQDAVTEGKRLVVTSGGHCLEGFVSDPEVQVLLDCSPMKGIYYDDKMRAIAVEAGATVGETHRALHDNWGVVLPLGEYPGIGMGGHVSGGAFGFLCRVLGLAADYLYAVEVVVVDEKGRANTVIATRDADDPNRELWWAHTGGGAGNFGIVTRYWFRSLDAKGNDPGKLLPRAPESITTFHAEWNWTDLDKKSFVRLLRNHGNWSERNSHPDSPDISLWSLLMVHRWQVGKIFIRGFTVDEARADRQIDTYLAALNEGTKPAGALEVKQMSWLDFALNPFPDLFTMPLGGVSMKGKDAMLKTALSDRQFEIIYDYANRTEFDVMGGAFGCATYGGRLNTVAPNATASAQRSSIFDMACNTGWLSPNEEADNLRWVRAFYCDLFADTGGVPVPGDRYDGTFINHPDPDLLDPALNTSGIPWHTLYYRDNYPRLQQVKARWDPRDVFRHALSIKLP